MELFEIQDFTNVILFVLNTTFEDFKTMYEDLGFIGDFYIRENYNSAYRDFKLWWCNIDDKMKMRVIKYVKNYYKN